MGTLGWIMFVVLNIPLVIGIGRLFFKTSDDFIEALGFWLKPDIISWFDGTHWEDMWAEFKLLMWIVFSGAIIFGEYMLLKNYGFIV